MRITVTNLFLKIAHNNIMKPVDNLIVTELGIQGNVECLPYRHILMLPSRTLSDFCLSPGQLRENVVLDGDDIHSVPSGTVIYLGDVAVRVTFHCEPCHRLKAFLNPKDIVHRRGVLGKIIGSGMIRIGDQVQIGTRAFEEVPYAIPDRIKWYLKKQKEPVFVSKLVHDIGLSRSYCRAIPGIIKRRDDIPEDMILYAGRK